MLKNSSKVKSTDKTVDRDRNWNERIMDDRKQKAADRLVSMPWVIKLLGYISSTLHVNL